MRLRRALRSMRGLGGTTTELGQTSFCALAWRSLYGQLRLNLASNGADNLTAETVYASERVYEDCQQMHFVVPLMPLGVQL